MANPYSNPAGTDAPDSPSGGGSNPSAGADAGASSQGGAVKSTQAPRGVVIDEWRIAIAATGVAQNAGNYRIPPGAHLELWPDPSNAQNCFAARMQTAVIQGPRAVFAASTPGRIYSGLFNTSQMWLAGTLNDGFLLRIVQG